MVGHYHSKIGHFSPVFEYFIGHPTVFSFQMIVVFECSVFGSLLYFSRSAGLEGEIMKGSRNFFVPLGWCII